MLEIYFGELFSNITNPKACFQARKIRLPFFHIDPYYYILSTSLLNESISVLNDRSFIVAIKPLLQ